VPYSPEVVIDVVSNLVGKLKPGAPLGAIPDANDEELTM
jgi:hypothetical protein